MSMQRNEDACKAHLQTRSQMTGICKEGLDLAGEPCFRMFCVAGKVLRLLGETLKREKSFLPNFYLAQEACMLKMLRGKDPGYVEYPSKRITLGVGIVISLIEKTCDLLLLVVNISWTTVIVLLQHEQSNIFYCFLLVNMVPWTNGKTLRYCKYWYVCCKLHKVVFRPTFGLKNWCAQENATEFFSSRYLSAHLSLSFVYCLIDHSLTQHIHQQCWNSCLLSCLLLLPLLSWSLLQTVSCNLRG